MQGNIPLAYDYLVALDPLLKDGVTTNLQRNQSEWLFRFDGQVIYMYTPGERVSYAYALMALAAHLIGRELDVRRYLEQIPPSDRTGAAPRSTRNLWRYRAAKEGSSQTGISA